LHQLVLCGQELLHLWVVVVGIVGMSVTGLAIVVVVPCVVIPRSEKEGMKPPYVCPGCSNHTHGNNMINRCSVINK
jgi:hypothetical protein